MGCLGRGCELAGGSENPGGGPALYSISAQEGCLVCGVDVCVNGVRCTQTCGGAIVGLNDATSSHSGRGLRQR